MSRLRSFALAFGPWGLLLLFWAWKTSEIWRHFTSRHYALWGVFFDTLNMVWMSWYSSLFTEGGVESLFHTDLINYPSGGITVLDQNLAFVHAMVAGLLRPVLGPTGAHNAVALAGLAAALVSVYLLLRHLSQSRFVPALLAILVVNYGLSWVNTLPDLELTFFVYPPLALYFWSRYVQENRWWLASAAVALLFWTCVVQMYYGLSLLFVLGTAFVVTWLGLSLPGATSAQTRKRTLLVLGVGLALALLYHFGALLQLDAQESPPIRRQAYLFSGIGAALLLAGVLLPAAVGFLLAAPEVVLWGLIVVPLAVISMGEELDVGPFFPPVPMPLLALKSTIPAFWRIGFSFRFVAPLLLGIAATHAALWRRRERLTKRFPQLTTWKAAAAMVGIFWLSAAYLPMIPKLERRPLGESDVEANLCAADAIDSCALVQSKLHQCTPEGTPRAENERTDFTWVVAELLAPFQPIGTVALPEATPCIRKLAEAPGKLGVLELTRSYSNGYRAYHQTQHSKALVGFPVRDYHLAIWQTKPSELTLLQNRYLNGEMERVPAAGELGRQGVGHVLVYKTGSRMPCRVGVQIPEDEETTFWAVEKVGFDRFQEPRPPSWPGPEEMAAAWGEPVCEDERLVLFEVTAGEVGP